MYGHQTTPTKAARTCQALAAAARKAELQQGFGEQWNQKPT
ncbi:MULTISPECIES: hypothetical protein [Pseudomonas]|nr:MULTISPECIES: hypothetical protein [Pseudomonas]